MSKLILDSIFFYYPEVKVLKGAYLEIPKNNITCLIGRNGSGKSTLFKIASGQLSADSGITFLGKTRLQKKSKSTRFKYIGYLPQEPFFPKSLRTDHLLEKSLANHDELVAQISDTKVKNLSAGVQRYLEIMFVLSLNREFIILDEPFTGLSPLLIEKVIGHIYTAKQNGAGILISDHYKHYISEIGDTFFLLENGQISPLK